MSETFDRLAAALADRYRVEREIGEGGMATVFMAEDLKHNRKVAIKVLKPELAAVLGADRFVQEIATTAALQHPNILPLFDSGTADGFLYYVMPFVEGESLRDRLNREKQLSVQEAVELTSEVADALHYAHEHGVVHRDIKPENILLHAGRPMVADFGIALAVSAAAGGRMTETGLSLGTPHYMSPEQATAEKDISGRSDVYSLASVLYEMLTGDPPHVGSSAQQIIMKIVTEEAAPVTKLRKSVPPNVAAAVGKGLEKLPADRFDSAKAFAAALADPAFRHGAAGASADTGSAMRPRPRWWIYAATAAAAILVLGAALGHAFTGGGEKTFDVGLPFDAPMAVAHTPQPIFALSPDGSFVVYVARKADGTRELRYRSLTGSSARSLAGTPASPYMAPYISPDGKRVAFVSPSGGLWVMPIAGGAATRVSESPDAWGGGWLDNGTLFYADHDNFVLRWVDPQTGPVRDLPVNYCPLPSLLSTSQVICGGGEEKFAVVGDVDRKPFTLRSVMHITARGERVPLRGSGFRPFDGKYLVYTSIDGTVMATEFVDRDSLLVGQSVALVTGVRAAAYTGEGFWDVSRDGTLVYAPGANMQMHVLVRRTLDDDREILPGDPAEHLRFAIGPHGRELASVVEGVRDQELRLYDLQTGKYEMLDQARYLSTPFWASGGQDLVYLRRGADSSQVVRRRLSSSEPPTALLTWPDDAARKWLVQYVDPSLMLIKNGDAGVIAVDATVKPARIDTVIPENTFFARISPDRHWLVWTDKAYNTYLSPWPKLDRRWTLATGQPYEPYWLPDGTLLIQGGPANTIYTMAIRPGADPPVGPLTPRFDDARMGYGPGWAVSIASDGAVIYPLVPDQPSVDYLRVVPHWLTHMERAVDEANK